MLQTALPTLNTQASEADKAIMREMTLADIPAVHTAELSLFPADAWPLDMFLAEITHETRAYVVLEEQNRIVGYAGAMSIADTADIQTIAVLPEYEGRGFGKAMLNFLHQEVSARGAQRILLEVRADNPRAQRLYERNGYAQIHVRKRYYNDGVDALIMQKDLSNYSMQGDSRDL